VFDRATNNTFNWYILKMRNEWTALVLIDGTALEDLKPKSCFTYNFTMVLFKFFI